MCTNSPFSGFKYAITHNTGNIVSIEKAMYLVPLPLVTSDMSLICQIDPLAKQIDACLHVTCIEAYYSSCANNAGSWVHLARHTQSSNYFVRNRSRVEL